MERPKKLKLSVFREIKSACQEPDLFVNPESEHFHMCRGVVPGNTQSSPSHPCLFKCSSEADAKRLWRRFARLDKDYDRHKLFVKWLPDFLDFSHCGNHKGRAKRNFDNWYKNYEPEAEVESESEIETEAESKSKSDYDSAVSDHLFDGELSRLRERDIGQRRVNNEDIRSVKTSDKKNIKCQDDSIQPLRNKDRNKVIETRKEKPARRSERDQVNSGRQDDQRQGEYNQEPKRLDRSKVKIKDNHHDKLVDKSDIKENQREVKLGHSQRSILVPKSKIKVFVDEIKDEDAQPIQMEYDSIKDRHPSLDIVERVMTLDIRYEPTVSESQLKMDEQRTVVVEQVNESIMCDNDINITKFDHNMTKVHNITENHDDTVDSNLDSITTEKDEDTMKMDHMIIEFSETPTNLVYVFIGDTESNNNQSSIMNKDAQVTNSDDIISQDIGNTNNETPIISKDDEDRNSSDQTEGNDNENANIQPHIGDMTIGDMIIGDTTIGDTISDGHMKNNVNETIINPNDVMCSDNGNTSIPDYSIGKSDEDTNNPGQLMGNHNERTTNSDCIMSKDDDNISNHDQLMSKDDTNTTNLDLVASHDNGDNENTSTLDVIDTSDENATDADFIKSKCHINTENTPNSDHILEKNDVSDGITNNHIIDKDAQNISNLADTTINELENITIRNHTISEDDQGIVIPDHTIHQHDNDITNSDNLIDQNDENTASSEQFMNNNNDDANLEMHLMSKDNINDQNCGDAAQSDQSIVKDNEETTPEMHLMSKDNINHFLDLGITKLQRAGSFRDDSAGYNEMFKSLEGKDLEHGFVFIVKSTESNDLFNIGWSQQSGEALHQQQINCFGSHSVIIYTSDTQFQGAHKVQTLSHVLLQQKKVHAKKCKSCGERHHPCLTTTEQEIRRIVNIMEALVRLPGQTMHKDKMELSPAAYILIESMCRFDPGKLDTQLAEGTADKNITTHEEEEEEETSDLNDDSVLSTQTSETTLVGTESTEPTKPTKRTQNVAAKIGKFCRGQKDKWDKISLRRASLQSSLGLRVKEQTNSIQNAVQVFMHDFQEAYNEKKEPEKPAANVVNPTVKPTGTV